MPLVIPFLRVPPSYILNRFKPGPAADHIAAVRRVWSKIVNGLPALEILEQRINRFNQLSATVLLPAKASDASYYDSEGQLRPEFAWYPGLIREIAQINEQLRKVIKDVAIPDLEQSKEKIEQQL